jgi:hypothetical protein
MRFTQATDVVLIGNARPRMRDGSNVMMLPCSNVGKA